MNLNFAARDQLFADGGPLPNAASELPGDEPGVIRQAPVAHIDQVENKRIPPLDLEREANGPLKEVAGEPLVIGQAHYAAARMAWPYWLHRTWN